MPSRSIQVLIAGWGLSLCITGCYNWQLHSASPRQVIEQQGPEAVRVIPTHGDPFVLLHPVVTGDTLVGIHSGTPARMPLADIERVAVRSSSPGKTALLITGIVLGTSMIAYMTEPAAY